MAMLTTIKVNMSPGINPFARTVLQLLQIEPKQKQYTLLNVSILE